VRCDKEIISWFGMQVIGRKRKSHNQACSNPDCDIHGRVNHEDIIRNGHRQIVKLFVDKEEQNLDLGSNRRIDEIVHCFSRCFPFFAFLSTYHFWNTDYNAKSNKEI
jgi:hypothetical protein